MLGFAANLSLMYGEHSFLDRFAAAGADGFKAVECQFPYDDPAAAIRARLDDAGLQQILINAPPGAPEDGGRGLACRPDRQAAFRTSLAVAIERAEALACPRIHVMAGLMRPDEDPRRLRATYVANLAWAAREAAQAGITLLIEPINQRDFPGYFISHQDEAHAIVAEIASPVLKVQMDLYHCQIVEGDLTSRLRQHLPGGQVGHLQIAGAPDRHEPDAGEIHYPHLFAVIEELGWDGWIGCEYRPRAGTSAGLGWLRAWQVAPAPAQPGRIVPGA